MEFTNLRINNVDYVVKYTPSKNFFESNNKPNHIIGIQLSGNARHRLCHGTLDFVQNTIYFLNKDDYYTVEVKEKGVAFSVHFTTTEQIDTKSFALNVNNNAEIVLLLEKIKMEFESKHRDNVILSDLYKLCSIYEELYKKQYTKTHKGVKEAIEYIDTHFIEKSCIKNAVKISGVSSRRFNDLFKSEVHSTPNKYIVYKKIEYAKKLLELENISITEIAEICGFSDVYYFSKCFKDTTGVSPSRYAE